MLTPIDTYLYDVAFRLRGSIPHNNRIIIVDVDEKTLSSVGRWPIRRKYYADLLDKLTKTSGVGFDIILSEASLDDDILNSAINRHSKVVLPVYITNSLCTSTPDESLFKATMGHIHVELGVDSVVRSVFHNISHMGNSLPSFSYSMYRTINGGHTNDGVKDSSNKTVPFTEIMCDKILQNQLMYINFYGPAGTFDRFSFIDVIEGHIPSTVFENKVVLVGATAAGLRDIFLTPFGREGMPGVELQAHILNNLMDGSEIFRLDPIVCLLIAEGLFMVLMFLFVQVKGYREAVIAVFLFLSILTTQFVFFYTHHLWTSPALFLLAFLTAFGLAHLFKLDRLGRLLYIANRDWEDSFNSISDAIVVFDRNCNRIRENEKASKTLNETLNDTLMEKCKEVVKWSNKKGKTVSNDSSPDTRTEIVDEISQSSLSKHYEITSIPRYGRNGLPIGSVHIIRDTTDQKISEYEREVLQDQLIKAQQIEAIAALAGGIAHDFNNILAAIVGFAEMSLLETSESEKVHGKIAGILSASQRGKDLVQQILKLGRQSDQEQKTIRLDLLVEDTLNLLRAALPSSIDIRTGISTKALTLGNPTQVQQVLMNLCINAAHAMQDGGGVLGITIENADLLAGLVSGNPPLQPGMYILLSVSDTGHGISSENMQRIFEPYFTTKAKGTGTGLGLATVHNIITNHGGSILVESEIKKGTTFRIYLPLTARGESSEAAQDVLPLPGGTERILFLDDEKSLLEIGRDMLTHLGYQVVTFSDPLEALARFKQDPDAINLIITDMTMPGMTGDRVCEEITKVRADIPIIICSGFSEQVSPFKTAREGATAFLMKPYLMSEFSNVIRSTLDKRP